MLFWAIPLIMITIILKKYYPDDSKDITNLSSTAFYGYFFISGMLFANAKNIWEYLKTYRKFNGIAFLISTLLFYGYLFFYPMNIFHLIFPLIYDGISGTSLVVLVSWTLVITLLGYGQVWFK